MDDAGAGQSDAPSPLYQDISLCPPDEPASQDTGFAQPLRMTLSLLKEKKKLKLEIKLLEIQNEYYALKLKRLKNTQ